MLHPVGSVERPLRVAIVGAGPSGFYAADALLRSDLSVRIHLFDRLPTPYGLVRHGVAPDHQRIKRVARAYARTLERDEVRFYGNVELGRTVTVEELQGYYDRIVLSVGAATDRKLGIPGENLLGSWSATELVGWYNGDPAFQDRPFDFGRARRAVVIGVGNVAVDVARILARDPGELAATDITSHALSVLAASGIEEIVMLGRRGAAQAKFSPSEIKELAELEHAELVISPEDAEVDPVSRAWLEAAGDRAAEKNVAFLQKRAAAGVRGARRRVLLRFLTSPVEILGDDGTVAGVRVERNRLEATEGRPRPVGTGKLDTIPCELVFRSVGYRGVAIPGVPFDDRRGIIPNDRGRVLDSADGDVVPRIYTAGWIKRGPTGLIGTNKADAKETVEALLDDLGGAEAEADAGWQERTDAFIRTRSSYVFDTERWRVLDAHEVREGERRGKIREKATSIESMIAATSGEHSRVEDLDD